MNKYVIYLFTVFAICVSGYFVLIKKDNNYALDSKLANNLDVAEEIVIPQKVKDLRLSEHDVSYLKIHILNEYGKYLSCSKIDFWEIQDGKLGKAGASNTFDSGETILIRPFVNKTDPPIRRSLLSNQQYAVFVNSAFFTKGYSEKLEFVTPLITSGIKEYEVKLKFSGPTGAVKQPIKLFGNLPQVVDSNSYSVSYLKDHIFLTKAIPKGSEFSISVPELGGELMVGGGDKSCAILHVPVVTRNEINNATVIDHSKLVEYEIKFPQLQHPTIIDFLPNANHRLGISWAKSLKGESSARVYLLPGTYFYRFSRLDATRNVNQKPIKEIIFGEKKQYELTP